MKSSLYRTIILFLLIPVVFFLGLASFGVYSVADNCIGVKRPLCISDDFIILSPGIHFAFPLSHRVSVYSLSDTIKMGFYRLGSFSEIKQIEAHSSDNHLITLHLLVKYQLKYNEAEILLKRFRGYLPREYFEYNIRKTIMQMISERNQDQFSSDRLPEFLIE
ncbi:SPFH domain-containing protein, partial [bacterium]|nr:SPFH domain-containing protein [bacterium]